MGAGLPAGFGGKWPVVLTKFSTIALGFIKEKIIDPFMIGCRMAKSLGQIHTTKFNYEQASTDLGEAEAFLCDNSAKLSTQFNRNIRMMQSYKWVGADLVVQLPEEFVGNVTQSTAVVVKGRMRYFAPTKGRCNALRAAYEQFMHQAKLQGVTPGNNKLFDFRVLPRGLASYPRNLGSPAGNEIRNLTTLDGINALSMVDGASSVTEAFTAYNSGVTPEDTNVTSADFSTGLRTQLGTVVTQTDFVLNEGNIQSGNALIADASFEEIPFTLSFDAVDKRTISLQWRPDPALYVSVLGGFVEVVLDEISATGATSVVTPINGVEMDISMHWAGWKSIVRPLKSRRSRKALPGKKKK